MHVEIPLGAVYSSGSQNEKLNKGNTQSIRVQYIWVTIELKKKKLRDVKLISDWSFWEKLQIDVSF